MAFMTSKIIVFEKYKVLIILAFFVVYLLPIFINERSHILLLTFKEGSIENPLRGKIWRYGFDSVLSLVLVEFLFVFSICSFCNRVKK